MAHRSATRHNINAPLELDPSALSRGQLVQMVIDLRCRLDEHRTKADRERELVTIHCNIVKRERETVTEVNHQLPTMDKGFARGAAAGHRVRRLGDSGGLFSRG